MIAPPSPLLKPWDIEVGKSIPVYGREIHIYDCDDSTKAFYEQYTGKRPEKIEIVEPEYQHFSLLPPPKGAYGSEEDTLGSCLQVTTRKPPARDLVKLMMHGNKAIRFEAVPENHVPEDAHRKFLIEVFLADGTVLVGERHIRNSGCWDGGKFKERDMPGGERRTMNPDTGKVFEPEDFFVGALVKISKMPMRIIRADEYTLKYMETDPDTFPQSALHLIIEKISGLIQHEGSLPATMTPEDFRDTTAERTGVELSDQELITILRNCNAGETADISLETVFGYIRCPPQPPPPPLRPGAPIPPKQ